MFIIIYLLFFVNTNIEWGLFANLKLSNDTKPSSGNKIPYADSSVKKAEKRKKKKKIGFFAVFSIKI